MKERPILFSGAMVRALLAGTKTQTRRAATHQLLQDLSFIANLGDGWWGDEEVYAQVRCPYGKPGDRLWVRETFFAWGRWETRYSAKKGRDEWHFIDMTLESGKAYLYAADGPRPQPLAGKRDGGTTPKWWKRPAIHMPRTASRITLEITSVRVERLQSISEADARAEGATYHDGHGIGHSGWRHDHGAVHADARSAYARLWNDINGPGSWEANPWVWAVEFRRLP